MTVGQEVFMKEVMFFKLPIHDDLDNAAIDLGFDTVQNLSSVPRVKSQNQKSCFASWACL